MYYYMYIASWSIWSLIGSLLELLFKMKFELILKLRFLYLKWIVKIVIFEKPVYQLLLFYREYIAICYNHFVNIICISSQNTIQTIRNIVLKALKATENQNLYSSSNKNNYKIYKMRIDSNKKTQKTNWWQLKQFCSNHVFAICKS